MVWIYGGGFVVGYSLFNVYGPHYILEHDVIVVSMNYRVGPFGKPFIHLFNKLPPSNASDIYTNIYESAIICRYVYKIQTFLVTRLYIGRSLLNLQQ